MKKNIKILIVILCLTILVLIVFFIFNKNKVNTINVVENNSIANTANTDEEVNDVNEAIRKALKDKEWLIENIIDDFDKKEENQENYLKMALDSIRFAKLKSDKPIYIIQRGSNEGQGTALMLIEYEYATVIVKELLTAEYSSFKIDFNKNVVSVIHDVIPYEKYYEIKDNNLVLIAEADEDTATYKINDKTVSVEEFKEFKNKYNFEEIQIKLTEENIEQYVK